MHVNWTYLLNSKQAYNSQPVKLLFLELNGKF